MIIWGGILVEDRWDIFLINDFNKECFIIYLNLINEVFYFEINIRLNEYMVYSILGNRIVINKID